MSTSDATSDEPLFIYPGDGSPELAAAHEKAKSSLSLFAAAVNEQIASGASCNVKIHFPHADGSEGAHVWLAVNELFGDMYFCSPRELPANFDQLKLSETLIVTSERIEDWMIMVGGILYGGYSLRALRELLAIKEKARFDDHTGISECRDGVP